jgi:hypothetical protein
MSSTPIDPRVRSAVLPSRILWQQGDVADSEILLRNNFGQALIHGAPSCRLRGSAASLLLDFGRELHGGVQLVVGPTGDYGPVHIRLRFGESASEAMSEPLSHHSLRDFLIPMPSMASQEFGLTGFRFVRIDVMDERELPLIACRAMTLMRDLPHVGAFKCSDERLNRIWQVGANTVHLCLQDYVWDGIKRDRAVWIGDLHPEAAVVNAVWGDLDIVPQSLDWARDHTPLPDWMNGIGSYSMWWIILQRDWYMAHGNRDYLEAQRDYLTRLLPVLSEQIQPNGTVQWRGRQFLDWPSSDNPAAVHAGLTALLAIALRAGAELCDVLGDTSASEQALAAAARLQVPSLPEPNKQASALLALSGLYEAVQVNQQILAHEPLRGISTFYGYYVLQARAQAGDVAGCLEVIRRYWGAMLDLGATSFWEDFDLSWAENAGRIDELVPEGRHDVHAEYGNYCYKGLRHSLCHGWAAGPTAWISEHLLGVRPLEPGCRKVLIQPHLCDLDWVEGAYPTPYGVIRLRHQRDSTGKTESHIEAPPEIQVVQ